MPTDPNQVRREFEAWWIEFGADNVFGSKSNARIVWQAATQKALERAVDACVEMALRYDADIEGCGADELVRYDEGIQCSMRLAYIVWTMRKTDAG